MLSPPAVKSRQSVAAPLVVGLCAAAIVAAFALLWSHGTRPLGNDSFGYLELAKQFRTTWPDHFGDWWPFGFPLLGAAISNLGLSAYISLASINAIALAALAAFFWYGARQAGASVLTATVVLLAGLCAPICPVVVASILSEPLFAASLLMTAIFLGAWPSRLAIIAAVFTAVAAFCVRYVGIFALPIVGVFAALHYKELRHSRRIPLVVATYVAGVAAIGLLCYFNYRFHGRISGPQPVGAESLTSLPRHAASFGWSLIAAWSSQKLLINCGGIRHPLTFLTGICVLSAITGLLIYAWRRRPSLSTRATVLLVAGYSASVIVLRSTTPFDDIASARTFLPILFPLLFLVSKVCALSRPRLLFAASCLALVGDGLFAARGMSREVAPDVTQERDALSAVIQPADTVSINGAARSVAAYFPNQFFPASRDWDEPAGWIPARTTLTLLSFAHASEVTRGNWSSRISDATERGEIAVAARADSYLLLKSSR